MTGFNPSLPRNLSGLFGPGLVRSDAISRPGIRPSSRLVPVEAAFDIPLGSDGRGIIVSNP
ncbi:MAG: hypothetical protein KJZ59_04925, partial [Pararhodobacter sp.]|nr:hypothetical protein [Pararhodobacter sp.]